MMHGNNDQLVGVHSYDLPELSGKLFCGFRFTHRARAWLFMNKKEPLTVDKHCYHFITDLYCCWAGTTILWPCLDILLFQSIDIVFLVHGLLPSTQLSIFPVM